MTPYPKQILTVDELLKTYADAGMEISDCTVARDILLEIGYYRLRGYSFHLYNHDTKQYKPGTSLEYILSLYRFDSELRNLIFSMTGEIEVTLRTRFCDVLLQSGDPLIYLDAAACILLYIHNPEKETGHSKIGYVDLMDSYHCSPTKYVCP